MAIRHDFPRIRCQLFDAERETLIFNVDTEHFGFDDITLLIEFGWMLQFLGPVQVRDMNQTVDPFVDADEDAEVGDIPHWPLDDAAHRILFLRRLPGIRHDLFKPEGDSAVPRIDV